MDKLIRFVPALLLILTGYGHGAAHGGGASPAAVDSIAYEELTELSRKLGMLRGMQRTWRSINRVNFKGNGDCLRETETNGECFVEMNFAQQALRSQVQSEAGQSDIVVYTDESTWQESSPGVAVEGSEVQVSTASRTLMLVPQGAVRAALEAESATVGSVDRSVEGKLVTYAFTTPQGNVTVTVEIDGLPTEIYVGSTKDQPSIVVKLSDYFDWELLDVPFPKAIEIQRGDDPSRRLNVTEYRTNPYLIFPRPSYNHTKG